MKRYLKYAVIMLALMAVAAAPEVVYVHSVKAVIMSGPSLKEKPVLTAARGDKLTVIEQSGRWYKVEAKGKTGWVSSLLVRPEPPMKRQSVFTDSEEDLSKGSRRRASAVTSAAAARGLTAEERQRLGYDARVDYAALEKIESVDISTRELSRFLRERK